jgi:hypothetical protein
MAEAIGLASGILTLVLFTYDTSKSLYEAVSSFKSQRKTVKDILTDLDSLVTILASIRVQAQRSSEVTRLEPLREPLNCCATICQEMREMLDACTTHSNKGRDSVRDWLNMRYKEKTFEDVSKRLASYKSTLTIAFQSINIEYHSTTQESLRNLKDLIGGTREDLEDQLEQVQQTISSGDTSSREILQDDLARLQNSLDSIARAQQIADTARPEVVIKDNKAGQGARAINGTDTTQPQFNFAVTGNEAGVGATMSNGVYSQETIQALLANSRTPDLALALQALQTQSSNTNHESLQSILKSLSAEHQGELTGKSSETSPVTILECLEYIDTRRTARPGQLITPEVIGNDGEVLERHSE